MSVNCGISAFYIIRLYRYNSCDSLFSNSFVVIFFSPLLFGAVYGAPTVFISFHIYIILSFFFLFDFLLSRSHTLLIRFLFRTVCVVP